MSKTRDIEQLISELCDKILIKEDSPNFEEAEKYVEFLKNEEIRILNEYSKEGNRLEIRLIVQNKISDYLARYRDEKHVGSPFDFDSGNSYQKYRDIFIKKYSENNNNADLPPVFEYVFERIKESSEQYRLFEQFYGIRQEDIDRTVKQSVQDLANMAVEEAKIQAEVAAKEASTVAVDVALKNAIKESIRQATAEAKAQAIAASEAAKDAAKMAKEAAKNEADNAVEIAMVRVTNKVSETSVTILGIFAGIVLAVVAGLFYSSSVLENMMGINLFRLICISALVGFVCFNLIAVMFLFIERFRTSKPASDSTSRHSASAAQKILPNHSCRKTIFDFLFGRVTRFVNITLLIIMVVTLILEIWGPKVADSPKNDGSDINISGEVNVSIVETGDGSSDSAEDTEEIEQSTETEQETDDKVESGL